jgi:predicted acylesterase/phospholipase RssA
VADSNKKRISLALGSGSARGWSHIEVIQTLEEMGIVPEIVCGSSIGAVVGAAYAAGRLESLQEWAGSLTRMDVASFFNLKFHRSGFETLAGSVNITHDRITRTRLTEDKPDIVIAPALSHIGLLEFYRADEAIEQGHASVRKDRSEGVTLRI